MPLKSAHITPDSAIMLQRSGCILFALWEELLRLRRSAIKTCSLDDIHDLRVATRRFRAALDLFESIVPKEPVAEIKKTIKNLTCKLGGLRNLDEAIVFFQSRLANDSATEKQLRTQLSGLRSGEIKQILKSLKKFDQHKNDKIVREIIAGMNDGKITNSNRFSLLAYFSDASIRLYLPIHHLLAASATPDHQKIRHELRIAIKKWRYFFEIISQILGRDYTPVLENLKEYQSLLGSMNDMIEFEALVNKLELSQVCRDAAITVLKTENSVLMERFARLVENKPLTYAFLI